MVLLYYSVLLSNYNVKNEMKNQLENILKYFQIGGSGCIQCHKNISLI